MSLNKHKIDNYSYLIILVFIYFIAKCLYIAFTLKYHVAPDERFHIGQIFNMENVDTWMINPNYIGVSDYGYYGQDRFLYHFLLGKILKIIQIPVENKLYFLRFFSILCSLANVFIFYKLLKNIFTSRVLQFVGVLLYTNVLMFTFLSASVNYDNLLNLFSILIIYHLVLVLKYKDAKSLLYSIIFFSLGILTKPSILPFGLMIGLMGIYLLIKRKDANIPIKDGKFKLLSFVTIAALILPILLFSRNYKLFDKPTLLYCGDVFGDQACKDEVYITALYNNIKNKHINKKRLSMYAYYDGWDDKMIERTFGVLGHQSMLISRVEKNILKVILFGSFFFFLFYLKRYDKIALFIFMVFAIYYLASIYHNYSAYLYHGGAGSGVQGRYLFPILSTLIICFLYPYSVVNMNKSLSIILGFSICGYFFFLDFPSYLKDENRYKFEHAACHSEIKEVDKYERLNSSSSLYIDAIKDGNLIDMERPFKVESNRKHITISGWAVDSKAALPAGGVMAKVGDIYIKGVYGLTRLDVSARLKDNLFRNTGYRINLPIHLLSTGVNTIEILAISNDNASIFLESKSIEIEKKSEDVINEALYDLEQYKKFNIPPLLYIEAINNEKLIDSQQPFMVDSSMQHVTISGWAADNRSSSSATGVLVKVGNEYIKGEYGLNRPDICALFNNEFFSNTGYKVKLSTNLFPTGNSLIEIFVISSDDSFIFSKPKRVKVQKI